MAKLTRKNRDRLVADLVSARHDLVALAQEHCMSPDALAAWVNEPENHRVLSGLCMLADLQTQVLLSRYRLLAAGRLIKLATSEGESGDLARKACVDLLRLDLKRAEARVSESEPANDDESATSLRELLYGKANAAEGDDACTREVE